MNTEKTLKKSFVWSVTLYGLEIWTVLEKPK